MKARKKSRSRLENWDEMTEFLALVSKPEIRWKNSRARLEARDWKKKILVLVSKHEIERKKISISSRSVRPEERNSRSRLGHEIERQIFSIPSRKLKQGSRWTLLQGLDLDVEVTKAWRGGMLVGAKFPKFAHPALWEKPAVLRMSLEAGFVNTVCLGTVFRDVALLASSTKLAMASLEMFADLDIICSQGDIS